MADREVTHTGKDDDGDITELCNPDEDWSPLSKFDAIMEIKLDLNRYYVNVEGNEVDIHVVGETNETRYLRTNWDDTEINNLDELPICP